MLITGPPQEISVTMQDASLMTDWWISLPFTAVSFKTMQASSACAAITISLYAIYPGQCSMIAECRGTHSSISSDIPWLQVSSYTELKAFLYKFASRSCGAIARSALHMSMLGKANPPGDLVGPWLPRRPMIQAAVRLPSGALLSPEADLFVEQACLAVRFLHGSHVAVSHSAVWES